MSDEPDLLDAHQRLLRAQRVAGLGFIDWDLATGRVIVSDETRRLLGLHPFERHLTIEDIVARVHPEDRTRLRELIAAAGEGAGEFVVDQRFVRLDGSVLWVHAHASLTRDAEGRPATLLGTILDITARKEAELALRDSEERLRLALDATGVGIWDWNLVTDTWVANDTYYEMLGYQPQHTVEPRRFWSDRIHPEDHDRIVEFMLRVRDDGISSFDIEYRIRHADGTYRWINSIGRAIRVDEQGRVVRMLGLRVDVSERKWAAERLAESEARAAHAQRLESIGQLTGGIAHDFNNLLTVIIGSAEEILEDVAQQPRLATLAKMVSTAGQRGAELTSRLLSFARRQHLAPKLIAPQTVLEGMLPLIRRSIGAHISVRALTDPDTWNAYVDPGQLEQAILNLCINARDAMPDGGELTLETGNVVLDEDLVGDDFELEPGEYALITVRDTGHGIDPNHLSQVFEPFFTTKPTGKGTGLGLSMVYGFTRQSGGTAKLHSELGHGTVVKMYLPRAAGSRGESGSGATDHGLGPRADGRAAVLLVEDDALVRHHAARLLRELDYDVIESVDGDAALRILDGGARVDLLFSDLMLPGRLKGSQLAALARKRRPGLSVLFTSGYTLQAIVQNGWADAASILLQKPYDRRQLAMKVRAALRAGG